MRQVHGLSLPSETNNVAAEHPDKVAELEKRSHDADADVAKEALRAMRTLQARL